MPGGLGLRSLLLGVAVILGRLNREEDQNEKTEREREREKRMSTLAGAQEKNWRKEPYLDFKIVRSSCGVMKILKVIKKSKG